MTWNAPRRQMAIPLTAVQRYCPPSMGGALLIRCSWLERGVVLHDRRPRNVTLKDIRKACSQRRAAAAIQSEGIEPGHEGVAADAADSNLLEGDDDRPVLEEALEIVSDRFGRGLVGERPVGAGRQQDGVSRVVGPHDRRGIRWCRSGQLLLPIVQPFPGPTVHIARVPGRSRPSLGRTRRDSEHRKRGRQKVVHGMAPQFPGPRTIRALRAILVMSDHRL
jgi:hypothetical protein